MENEWLVVAVPSDSSVVPEGRDAPVASVAAWRRDPRGPLAGVIVLALVHIA